MNPADTTRRRTLPGVRACLVAEAGATGVIYRAMKRGRQLVLDRLPGTVPAALGIPVVTALSARESLLKTVSAPYAAVAKARRVLPTLLDLDLPFSLDTCAWDTVALARLPPSGTLHFTAVLARLADVERLIAAGRSRGLEPAVVDQEAVALWTQGLIEFAAAPDAPSARRFLFARDAFVTLVTGQGTRLEAVFTASTDDFSPLDRALTHLDAAAPQSCLYGVACAAPALETRLRDWLRAQAGTSTTVWARDPEHFMPRALAERALAAGDWRCNLRNGALTHPLLLRQARQRGQFAAGVVASLALALGLMTALADRALREQVRTLELATASLCDRLAGYHVTARGEQAIRQVEVAVRAYIQARVPLTARFEPGWERSLPEVVRLLHAEDCVVDSCDWSRGRFTALAATTAPEIPPTLAGPLAALQPPLRIQARPATPGRTAFVLHSADAQPEAQP